MIGGKWRKEGKETLIREEENLTERGRESGIN